MYKIVVLKQSKTNSNIRVGCILQGRAGPEENIGTLALAIDIKSLN